MMRKTMMTLLKGLIPMAASINVAGARAELPSESFRKEHVEIRRQLDQVAEIAGELPAQSGDARRESARKITRFFREHIQPHAEREEIALYPAVDKRAGCRLGVFTATMRNDHRIVSRWISELEKANAQGAPDARDFARRTDRLLGLISAHFENEESVLLPVLDRTMTPEEFDREIMTKMRH